MLKPIPEMSAQEIAAEIEEATYFRIMGPSPRLVEALQEVDRLRGLLIDIVDICNTDPVTYRSDATSVDYDKVLNKIDDLAHKYYMP